MDYQKSYLKYKKKYISLKKQYGGALSDEITSVVPIIQELEEYRIELSPDIVTILLRGIQLVKDFSESKSQEIHEKKSIKQQQVELERRQMLEKKHAQRQQLEENKRDEIPDRIIQMLWIGFYKSICDTITTYHESIMSHKDDSRDERMEDIKQKLQAINNLLKEQWNYYLPPLLSDLRLHDSFLKKEMLYSKKYGDKKIYLTQVQPRYGYTNRPEIVFNTHSYEELVHAYEEIRTVEHDQMSIFFIAQQIKYAENNFIRDIYNVYQQHDAARDHSHIPSLLHDKYGSMTYSQLLENFPERIFVNLEPSLDSHSHQSHYHYIHISIRNLFDN